MSKLKRFISNLTTKEKNSLQYQSPVNKRAGKESPQTSQHARLRKKECDQDDEPTFLLI